MYKDIYKILESIGINKIYSVINQLFFGHVLGKDNISSKILKTILEIIILYIHYLFK